MNQTVDFVCLIMNGGCKDRDVLGMVKTGNPANGVGLWDPNSLRKLFEEREREGGGGGGL